MKQKIEADKALWEHIKANYPKGQWFTMASLYWGTSVVHVKWDELKSKYKTGGKV